MGKRTDFGEYRLQTRGGKGVITMKTTERTGGVVGALTVAANDEMMLITTAGQMVRIAVSGIRETGRVAQGVKLVDLEQEDKLQAIAPVISEETGDEEPAEEPPLPPSAP
jgi:DNA gyrase subunit A